MFKVGDKVRVVSTRYFDNFVLIGDVFEVLEVDTVINMLTLTNERFARHLTWIPDGEVEKIEIEPYIEPEYIKNVRIRVRKLSVLQKFYKYKYKRRDKLSSEKKVLIISKYFEISKELNDLYTILRQHNQMKKMYYKVRMK